MKVTILGCGTSVGIPCLGKLGWGKCNPNNPLNRRQRCSILIEKGNFTILVDAGPDIRNQLLKSKVEKIDAVLITHTHSDHVSGLPELRPFYWPERKKIPIYTNSNSIDQIEKQFDFLFIKKDTSPSYFTPPMTLNEIKTGPFKLNSIEIEVLNQFHGNINSLGFKFDNKFAYSTDLNDMPEENFNKLKDLDLWIVEGLREEPHEAHAHFSLSFNWIRRLSPKKAVLTHLGWESDYDYIKSICPQNVTPGYDGMEFNL